MIIVSLIPSKNDLPEYLKEHQDFFSLALPTGSRVICDPPPEDTDEDWVLLTDDKSELITRLDRRGWDIGGSEQTSFERNVFTSFKKSMKGIPWKINVIITADPNFFWDFEKATRLCKKLNLLKKEDRVAVFKAIRDNIYPGDEVPEKKEDTSKYMGVTGERLDWFDEVANLPPAVPEPNPPPGNAWNAIINWAPAGIRANDPNDFWREDAPIMNAMIAGEDLPVAAN